MSIFEGILNQQEAAKYLTEHGFKIDHTTLSKITSAGIGPRFERNGYTKFFRQEWLDEFLATNVTPTPNPQHRDEQCPRITKCYRPK